MKKRKLSVNRRLEYLEIAVARIFQAVKNLERRTTLLGRNLHILKWGE